ncbi:MAG: MobC family plasmid mobilization relaxosome protein [Defluviitaleaceae bacterium]|nr:MobC family plasmid mobilization relaxosome protein [Defluviitaleaceae bacterium]
MDKSVNNYKHKRVQIFVSATKDEHEKIKQRAKKYNFPVSIFMREMALKGTVVERNYLEMRQLIWEINKIGVNINQIVKLCNESRDVSDEFAEQLEREHSKVWGLLKDLAEAEDRLFTFGEKKRRFKSKKKQHKPDKPTEIHKTDPPPETTEANRPQQVQPPQQTSHPETAEDDWANLIASLTRSGK